MKLIKPLKLLEINMHDQINFINKYETTNENFIGLRFEAFNLIAANAQSLSTNFVE